MIILSLQLSVIDLFVHTFMLDSPYKESSSNINMYLKYLKRYYLYEGNMTTEFY